MMRPFTVKFVIGLSVLFLFLFLFLAKLSPGSYADAEKYEVDVSESELISLVEAFKRDNPMYQVPPVVRLEDGRQTESDHWYHVYFYYPQENQLIHTWVREDGRKKATFGFVGIREGLGLGSWKRINKLSRGEDLVQKERFENRILNPIKKKIPL